MSDQDGPFISECQSLRISFNTNTDAALSPAAHVQSIVSLQVLRSFLGSGGCFLVLSGQGIVGKGEPNSSCSALGGIIEAHSHVAVA